MTLELLKPSQIELRVCQKTTAAGSEEEISDYFLLSSMPSCNRSVRWVSLPCMLKSLQAKTIPFSSP